MRSVTRSATLPRPVSSTRTLTEVAVDLTRTALADNRGEREISLLAVSLSNLVRETDVQLELGLGLAGERHRPGTPVGAARQAVDRTVDDVRDRFGRGSVGYTRVAFREGGGVPDEFRELAEGGPEGSEPVGSAAERSRNRGVRDSPSGEMRLP